MSMSLISASVIIFDQLDYLNNKNLGFRKEEVIVIPAKDDNGLDKFEVMRNELMKIDGVTSVSASSNIPGRQFNQHSIASAKKPLEDVGSSEAFVDYDFFQTLGIDFVEGRSFLRENPSDTSAAFVINETAAKQLYLQTPVVGQEIIWHDDEVDVRGTVIGVVKDFHFQSLHEPIRPLLFGFTDDAFNHILVKINPENFNEKIAAIEKAYKLVEPYYGFEFAFLDDSLNKQYAAEQRTGTILGAFSFIAISIACFGLFGMSMLTFQQKVKEISVRKVLGATPMNLLVLLLGNFTKLIVLSIVIAIPVVWWIMDGWLDNFSYQVNIHPMIFVASGLVLISISWVTLSYFGLKASRLNPAETLKNE
jgi:putative ABC transport system permease protein